MVTHPSTNWARCVLTPLSSRCEQWLIVIWRRKLITACWQIETVADGRSGNCVVCVFSCSCRWSQNSLLDSFACSFIGVIQSNCVTCFVDHNYGFSFHIPLPYIFVNTVNICFLFTWHVFGYVCCCCLRRLIMLAKSWHFHGVKSCWHWHHRAELNIWIF